MGKIKGAIYSKIYSVLEFTLLKTLKRVSFAQNLEK